MSLRKPLVICLLLFFTFTALQAHIPDSLVNPQHLPARSLLRPLLFKSGPMAPDTMIVHFLNQVNEDSIGAGIQHLQEYGTRMCNSPQAFQVQNWILTRLQGYGYNTYVQPLSQPVGSSGNVIATLTGTVFPNEYIVLGAHYDSFTGLAEAPGADDNASGSAGIMEIARVLSQHSFNRSIILCLWAAEEFGCYGSTAYTQQAATNNMNILGYLNLDMCGYLYGNVMHTNVVGPASAQPLLDFYQDVCSQYLPAFQVTIGGNLPGTSDHESFNAAGYMGIFPFEDVDHYSPFIHTAGDTLGTSVNSLAMAAVFARSVLATALEMANQVPAPLFLTAQSAAQQITLKYINPGVQASEYHIYRDDMNNVYATTVDTFFIDQNITAGTTYQYAVSLVSAQNGRESIKSNTALGKAVGPVVLPFTDDLENDLTWWMTTSGWGLTGTSAHSPVNSLTDSPSGNYTNLVNSSVYLLPFSLEGYNTATLTFWCKYNLENNYDYIYMEISDGGEYQLLGTYTGDQDSWILNGINLHNYGNKPYISIRFRIVSDDSQVADGFYLDDLIIEVPGVGLDQKESSGWSIQAYPNPFEEQVQISVNNPTAGYVQLDIFNLMGQHITRLCDGELKAGMHQFTLDASRLCSGIYYYRLVSGGVILSGKLVRGEE